MKSWVRIFFPTTDEYKEQQLSFFLAEGSVVFLVSIIGMLIYSSYFFISVKNALFIPILIFLVYMMIRHAASGIEFADVTTDKAYKKELKVIFSKIGVFFIVMSGYLLIFRPDKWVEAIVAMFSLSLIWFLTSFISLKRSYHKNKSLL